MILKYLFHFRKEMSGSKFSYFTIFCLASMKDAQGGLCSLPSPTHVPTLSAPAAASPLPALGALPQPPHNHLLHPLSTRKTLFILLRSVSITFPKLPHHTPVTAGLSHSAVPEHVPCLSAFLSWGISSGRPKLVTPF